MPVRPMTDAVMGARGQRPMLGPNGEPLDEEEMPQGMPPEQDPTQQDPNAMVDPNDPNAQPVDPNDPEAQGSVAPMPSYYDDPDDEEDEDEDADDPEAQMPPPPVRKSVKPMDNEPLATDTEILKTMISKAVGSALAPFVAKINELVVSNNKVEEENASLRKSITDLSESLTKGVIKGIDPATQVEPAATAKPADPTPVDTDVTKSVVETTEVIDPDTTQVAGDSDALLNKANSLVLKGRETRTQLMLKSTTLDNINARADLSKALGAVQSGNVTTDSVKALQEAISRAESVA